VRENPAPEFASRRFAVAEIGEPLEGCEQEGARADRRIEDGDLVEKRRQAGIAAVEETALAVARGGRGTE